MIAPHAIQEVKEAARVEEVVGEFVALKRKGSRYLGLCPFHNEKTPSFNVTPNLGIYKCFGCGEAGDSITFLTKHEHLSYVEALKWLAKRYNIDLPEEEQTPEQEIAQSERESLSVIQQWAMNWSMEQLWETDEGKRIGLSYFRERGFSDATIKEFQLGYVPEQGNAFAYAAQANGFNAELLEKAGWIKHRESDGSPWDFFQGRVTFPIHGLSGSPIAFGARTLKSDKKLPKYFNSPESLLYVKSKSLYGIYQAKKSIVQHELCYLVEGYTDVISLHQAGITNVVASSGTSLTEDQVRLIKRYAATVCILYDGDAAGMKASLRGIDLILKEGLNVKVVTFPEGEDPDSYAKSHSSSEVSAHLTEHAQDFLVFKAELLMADSGNDPVKKAAAIHEIVESVSLVPDLVLRALYVKQCSTLLQINEQALISEMNKVLRRQYKKKLGGDFIPEAQLTPDLAPPQPIVEDLGTAPQERDLLRMLLSYGHERIMVKFQDEEGNDEEEETSVAELMFELLALDDILFDEPLFREIYLDYRHKSNLGEAIDAARYVGHEEENWRTMAIDLLTEKHDLSPNWKERHKIHVKRESEALRDALEEAVDILKERRVDRMIRDRQEDLKTADELNVIATLQEIMKMTEAKKKLAKKTGRVVVG
ncbi:MAG: DNA primase [Flavobacteriales bacterium]|nr:DNA primase [Flavobacteriales bacterium]